MTAQLVAAHGRLQIGGVICRPDGTVKSPLLLSARVPVRRRRRFLFLPFELQHQTTTRNAVADAVVDRFDTGSLLSAGAIRIYTAGKIDLLSTVPMANPAFGDAVSGVANGLSLPWSDPLAADSGTAAEFEAIDRDENIVLQGDTDELVFPQYEIAVNDIVKLLSINYTAPP